VNVLDARRDLPASVERVDRCGCCGGEHHVVFRRLPVAAVFAETSGRFPWRGVCRATGMAVYMRDLRRTA
jgi:hypothetical protein